MNAQELIDTAMAIVAGEKGPLTMDGGAASSVSSSQVQLCCLRFEYKAAMERI